MNHPTSRRIGMTDCRGDRGELLRTQSGREEKQKEDVEEVCEHEMSVER